MLKRRMDVVFRRTAVRGYAIEIGRPGMARVRMDPAPGFDGYLPHDLLHFVVEEQLGLDDGIFGRVANGGTSKTFRTAVTDGVGVDTRTRKRAQRATTRREAQLSQGDSDFGQSERATYVCWQNWVAHHGEPGVRARAATMRETADGIWDRMPAAERAALTDEMLTCIRARLSQVSELWRALAIGDGFTLQWATRKRSNAP
jgi:hypothetical protein